MYGGYFGLPLLAMWEDHLVRQVIITVILSYKDANIRRHRTFYLQLG